jgi:hypothetical protein
MPTQEMEENKMKSEDGYAFSQAVNGILSNSDPESYLKSKEDKDNFKASVKALFWLILDVRKELDIEIDKHGR